ncbi:hypothetical protein FRC12_002704 [Ceratobasidium sp. 428]|nr:hypothetical protein FRC09_019093 [Ceratobasidium sp. 395]KAG8773132.1 hypothetical protein FRC12_002704 [Ceratobasidium sp. 428]
MTAEKKTEIRGFPAGSFLIRSHHSRSLYHGRRLLQVNVNDGAQSAELAAWVDESKGELQEDERLKDHDNQVFYIDEYGGLHSKACSREHFVHCRFDPSTMNIELSLQSPQQQSERPVGRACQFSYNRDSKIITVSAPLTDETSDSDSDGASVASSPVSERSFPELAQQEFALELIPQKHNSNVARFWNYYVNTQEDEEQHQQNTEEETPAVSNDLAADSSWHRRREVRLVAGKDTNGCQTNMFQRWDIIPLH